MMTTEMIAIIGLAFIAGMLFDGYMMSRHM